MNRIDPTVVGAVLGWSPRTGPKPSVDLESWSEGLRVKLTYLGVETGILFIWGAKLSEHLVVAELDRVYDVLSWRVTQPRN